jgi:hypothetical protein
MSSERMLLFCVANNTNWRHPATPGEIITTMVVKGLIDRDATGELTLTDRGRADCDRLSDGCMPHGDAAFGDYFSNRAIEVQSGVRMGPATLREMA